MKTAALAATAILALLVTGVAATTYAHQSAAPAVAQPNHSAAAAAAAASSHGDRGKHANNGTGEDQDRRPGNPLGLTVGENLTLSGLTGRYASTTNSSVNGNATGAITFQVTQSFKRGYILTISSGSVTLGGTTYTITGGSIELNPAGMAGSGSGSTSPSGQFLVHLNMHGTSASLNGRAVLDMKAGGSEYLVTIGTQGSGASESD